MKTNKILFALLTLLILAGFASAFQVEDVTIGSDKQDRVTGVTSTFKITNNNSTTLNNIQVTSSAASQYAVTFSNVPTSLAAGASETVTVTATIPTNFNAVNTNLEETAFSIGTLTVTGILGTTTETETADIKMQAVNQLEIKKVTVKCGSKEERLDDGERMEELLPDTDDCSITIEVENTFRSSDKNDQKIGDIEFDPATIEVESDDSDVDIDEEDDINSFDADETDEVSFDFEIDEEADDGTYNVAIRLFGTDDNGAYHGEKWEVKLEVERLKYDIQFKNIDVIPSEMEACKDEIVKVSATVYNMGRRDEDESAVELKIPDLKYTKKIENIELDRDEKTTVHFDVPLPTEIKAGTYRGTLKSYFDTNAESNTKTIEIVLTPCKAYETEEKEEEKQTTVVVPQETKTQIQIPPVVKQSQEDKQTTETQEGNFTESTAYLSLLIALVVLLLGAIVVISIVFFVKKK